MELLTVWLRDGTLRCACYIIGMIGIFCEELTKPQDHSRIVLAVPVVEFDVEVETVDEGISKGPCFASLSAHKSMNTQGTLSKLTHCLVPGVAYILEGLAT